IHESSRSCEVHNPVGLPCFAAVGRKRLLPTTGFFGDLRPDEAAVDVDAVVRFVSVKLAASVLPVKTAYHREFETSAKAGRPPDTPLVRFRIVQAQADTFQHARFSIHDVLVERANAAENGMCNGCAFKFLPFG